MTSHFYLLCLCLLALAVQRSDAQCYQHGNAANCSTLHHGLLPRSVQELHVYGDHKALEPGVFRGLSNLRELHVSGVGLHTLHSSALQGLDGLRTLDLSHNRLTSLQDISRALTYVPRLQKLVLRGNPLGRLPTLHGEHLESLDVGYTKLKTIADSGLQFLSDLKHLKLDGNHLSVIKPKWFPKSLVSLDVSYNIIGHFSRHEFHGLDSLEHLEFTGNPLVCDCETLKIRYQYIVNGRVLCVHPRDLRGVDLFTLKKKDVCGQDRVRRDVGEEPEVNGDETTPDGGDENAEGAKQEASPEDVHENADETLTKTDIENAEGEKLDGNPEDVNDSGDETLTSAEGEKHESSPDVANNSGGETLANADNDNTTGENPDGNPEDVNNDGDETLTSAEGEKHEASPDDVNSSDDETVSNVHNENAEAEKKEGSPEDVVKSGEEMLTDHDNDEKKEEETREEETVSNDNQDGSPEDGDKEGAETLVNAVHENVEEERLEVSPDDVSEVKDETSVDGEHENAEEEKQEANPDDVSKAGEEILAQTHHEHPESAEKTETGHDSEVAESSPEDTELNGAETLPEGTEDHGVDDASQEDANHEHAETDKDQEDVHNHPEGVIVNVAETEVDSGHPEAAEGHEAVHESADDVVSSELETSPETDHKEPEAAENAASHEESDTPEDHVVSESETLPDVVLPPETKEHEREDVETNDEDNELDSASVLDNDEILNVSGDEENYGAPLIVGDSIKEDEKDADEAVKELDDISMRHEGGLDVVQNSETPGHELENVAPESVTSADENEKSAEENQDDYPPMVHSSETDKDQPNSEEGENDDGELPLTHEESKENAHEEDKEMGSKSKEEIGSDESLEEDPMSNIINEDSEETDVWLTGNKSSDNSTDSTHNHDEKDTEVEELLNIASESDETPAPPAHHSEDLTNNNETVDDEDVMDLLSWSGHNKDGEEVATVVPLVEAGLEEQGAEEVVEGGTQAAADEEPESSLAEEGLLLGNQTLSRSGDPLQEAEGSGEDDEEKELIAAFAPEGSGSEEEEEEDEVTTEESSGFGAIFLGPHSVLEHDKPEAKEKDETTTAAPDKQDSSLEISPDEVDHDLDELPINPPSEEEVVTTTERQEVIEIIVPKLVVPQVEAENPPEVTSQKEGEIGTTTEGQVTSEKEGLDAADVGTTEGLDDVESVSDTGRNMTHGDIRESEKVSTGNSAGSYVVLGVIMCVIVALLAYAVIRSRQKQKKNGGSDVENPGRELQDVSRPLIESKPPAPAPTTNGPMPDQDETKQPLMATEEKVSVPEVIVEKQTNGDVSPKANGNGVAAVAPQISPASGRVKVVAKELPDSVAKRPILIVNRGPEPPV